MKIKPWYAQLNKPAWAPPAWLFGPVWAVLYFIIAISFSFVFWLALNGAISPWLALPFGLNLIFNAAFAPLQFGLRSNGLAAIDVTLVVITLVWALVVIHPVLPWVAYANLPYLAWGLFATALQYTITWINRDPASRR
ncbi:TspO/MBR family protein [Maricaulis sp.]|uniref:TspO/MBR family protein n=1 Tax=Maricaulis sp. TaxID=1486257 RepID=UPI003A8CB573